jgi:ABC transporter substrate binding protein
MRRRDFIRIVGSAAAWPLGAHAQQPERMRRVGVLMNFAENDPAAQARLTAFLQALQQLGWTNGRNVRIDTRWSAGDPERNRRYAAELVALTPDAILASTTVSVAALLQATRALPIVFVQVADPVGAGFIASLAKPGGQRHRIYHLRVRYGCEMARNAQGDRPARDASGESYGIPPASPRSPCLALSNLWRRH